MAGTNLGKRGPHPDLAGLITSTLAGRFDWAVGQRIELLQQRTFHDEHDPFVANSGSFRLTSCLARIILPSEETGDALVLFDAYERGNAGWFPSTIRVKSMGRPPLSPLVAAITIVPKLRFCIGMFVTHPDIAALRLTLSDGTVMEDSVEEQTALMMVPLRGGSPAGSSILVTTLAADGREIISDSYDTDPQPRTT